MTRTIIIWIVRLVAAIILLQTLFFKFTGAEVSVYIFTTVGMEPWGRIGSGIVELIASLLILWPATTKLGSLIGLGVMGGAIFFHLTRLGINVQGDGGQLFGMSIVVAVCCVLNIVLTKGKLLG